MNIITNNLYIIYLFHCIRKIYLISLELQQCYIASPVTLIPYATYGILSTPVLAGY